MDESRLKISNPERVSRILRRICQASLPVMVRSTVQSAVAVKGRAASFLTDGLGPGMRIANMSDRGIAHLGQQNKVQVEFVMMATKVVFVSSIVARDQNSIVVRLPASLVSIERRKNARYNCTEDLTAFLHFSLWRPQLEDVLAPPFYTHHRDLASYVSIADLSFGGLCAVSRFPALCNVLRRGIIDDKAKLHLPMQAPLEVSVEIRWFKRIKTHVDMQQDDQQAITRSYRFGIEFINPSDQVRINIRQFIHQLSQAGAI